MLFTEHVVPTCTMHQVLHGEPMWSWRQLLYEKVSPLSPVCVTLMVHTVRNRRGCASCATSTAFCLYVMRCVVNRRLHGTILSRTRPQRPTHADGSSMRIGERFGMTSYRHAKCTGHGRLGPIWTTLWLLPFEYHPRHHHLCQGSQLGIHTLGWRRCVRLGSEKSALDSSFPSVPHDGPFDVQACATMWLTISARTQV